MSKKKRWTTIVGEHVAKVAPPPDSMTVRYLLETVTNAGNGGEACSQEQRDRLLYERGEGPQKPDEKPEPTSGPRDRRTFRGADRPPIPWSGVTKLSALPGPMLDAEREFWKEGK